MDSASNYIKNVNVYILSIELSTDYHSNRRRTVPVTDSTVSKPKTYKAVQLTVLRVMVSISNMNGL
jgi:hypothetical protein